MWLHVADDLAQRRVLGRLGDMLHFFRERDLYGWIKLIDA